MKKIIMMSIAIGCLASCAGETPTSEIEQSNQESSEQNEANEDTLGVSDVSAQGNPGGQLSEDVIEPESTGDTASEESDGEGGESGESEDAGPAAECTDDGNCNDLDPCTADSCLDGFCVQEVITPCCTTDAECNDEIDCTLDSCNTFTNACEHVPEDNLCCVSESDCNDFKDCTVDLCLNHQCISVWESGEGCNCVADLMCDDNNACTADTCEQGACTYTAVDGEGCCNDGNCPDTLGAVPLCVYNLCWLGQAACEGEADCTAPTACWTGECTGFGCAYYEIPDCCQTDFECDDGQEATTDVCIENACVYTSEESIPCVLDVDCLTANECSVGTCTPAGVCSITVKEGENCCSATADCVQPDNPCQENVCEEFTCTTQNLTGVQSPLKVTFNDGTLEGWSEESNGAGAYWHVSDYQSPDGEFALYFGQDNAINYDVGIAKGAVHSPLFDKIDGKMGVQFDRIAHVEPISSRDLFWLDVLQGEEPTEVWNKNVNGPGLGWKTEIVDITDAVEGNNFRLRFSFDSIDAINNQYEGLYLDNIAVGFLCE